MSPTPTTLSDSELTEVLHRIAPNGREFGAARIARLLAQEHSVHTVRINMLCSVGNISDQVAKGLNSRIKDLGLFVGCVKPPYPIYNKFNQPSGQMLWSFFRKAANDEDTHTESLQDALRRDYSAITTECNLGDPLGVNEHTGAENGQFEQSIDEFTDKITSVDFGLIDVDGGSRGRC